MQSNIKQITVVISDPGADAKIPLLRAPADGGVTIQRCFATSAIAIAAHTANYLVLSLLNGGTAEAGTALITDEIGGTAGWAANTKKEMTVVAGSGKLTADQILLLNMAETGTYAGECVVVNVEYVPGIGSKANA